MALPKAIREMPLWSDAPFAGQIPAGLDIRRGNDASGRDLVVVSNAMHKAFSFPAELIVDNNLPEFFLERLKTL